MEHDRHLATPQHTVPDHTPCRLRTQILRLRQPACLRACNPVLPYKIGISSPGYQLTPTSQPNGLYIIFINNQRNITDTLIRGDVLKMSKLRTPCDTIRKINYKSVKAAFCNPNRGRIDTLNQTQKPSVMSCCAESTVRSDHRMIAFLLKLLKRSTLIHHMIRSS